MPLGIDLFLNGGSTSYNKSDHNILSQKKLTISHIANDTINTHTSTENLHICLENAVLLFHKSEWLNKTQSKGSIVKEGENVAALICNQKAEVSAREAAQTIRRASFLLEWYFFCFNSQHKT